MEGGGEGWEMGCLFFHAAAGEMMSTRIRGKAAVKGRDVRLPVQSEYKKGEKKGEKKGGEWKQINEGGEGGGGGKG